MSIFEEYGIFTREIFLFYHKKVCCMYSLESRQRDYFIEDRQYVP